MKNFTQKGDRLRLYPAESITSGQLVVVNDIAAVAFHNYDVADGDGVICDLCGVYPLPKAVGAWEQGWKLYYDHSAKKVTTTEAGNTFIGHAAEPTPEDAEEGQVRLKG